ncbi:MAG: hypothetical protein GXO85_16970 [Chlorobi bacterium]|nr:hypothetical protein [Chlorobiota bacterium]
MKTKTAIIILIIIMGCSSMNETVENMYKKVDVKNTERITEKDIQYLPDVVQRYLRHVNIIGKEKIKTVRLKQRGNFRLKPEDDFRTMEAEQYINTEAGEFYWKGKVGIITAIDKFIGGRGNMTVKLLGLVKVAEMEGEKIDQGELIRFLAEGVWFPTIFVEDFIKWEALNNGVAKATITLDKISVSALFHFNERNEVARITAKRYMEKDGEFTLEDWEIRNLEYKIFDGILIPSRSDVIWNLNTGKFCWYKPEILEIEYNVTSTF